MKPTISLPDSTIFNSELPFLLFDGGVGTSFNTSSGLYGRGSFIVGGFVGNSMSLGGGVGVRDLGNYQQVFPLFIDVRFGAAPGKSSGYMALNFGYSLDATRDGVDPGFAGGLNTGMKLALSNRKSIFIGAFVDLTSLKVSSYRSFTFSTSDERSEEILSIGLNLGFSF
jgi:hypothetical protein